jgi:hypothetical protein
MVYEMPPKIPLGFFRKLKKNRADLLRGELFNWFE